MTDVLKMAGKAALPTPKEMAQADEIAAKLGSGSYSLMQSAAAAVADKAAQMLPDGRIALLAGPGNNGGDAILAAHYLRERGRDVTLFMESEPKSRDAQSAFAEWGDGFEPLAGFDCTLFGLVVDGLFGAGLQRPLTGIFAETTEKLAAAGAAVLAVDLPSGLSGLTGLPMGPVAPAGATVTFFRRKPGHVLEPGRSLCGEVVIADIGIPETVLEQIEPAIFANEPDLWLRHLHMPRASDYKYARGHAVVFSGGYTHTGAARLSAMAALRGGAGLVTVFSPSNALAVNAAHLTAIMLKRCNDAAELGTLLADERLNAFVLGPAFGIGESARDYASLIMAAGRALVLDADGLTSFASHAADLFQLSATTPGQMVMTPHMGEFARLFPDIAARMSDIGKVETARRAAALSGSVIVLKGSDTVIAAPDGRAAINETGSPFLATAGTGDVLTGLVAAQLANHVPAFEAACIGVWLHGVAARMHGPGLIAEDLPLFVPRALSTLYSLSGFSIAGWPPR